MVVCRQFLLEQAIQRGLRGFVERGGGFVEEQVLRRVQQRAREPEALLLAERERPVPVPVLRRAATRAWAIPPLRAHWLIWLSVNVPSLAGIFDRPAQRSDREIRPLRQHHQGCPRRNGDRAGAERPDAGDRAEQRRLAGAGRAGDQRALALAQAESIRVHQRRSVRQSQRQPLEVDGAVARGLDDVNPVVAGCKIGCAAAIPASNPSRRFTTACHSASWR